ncbi:MAG: copper amine oxidase N-terminal domain-containing protein [Bacillota bacterium]
MSRLGKRVRFVWATLLMAMLLFGLLSTMGSAADPEPEWTRYPDSNYDPGPGWPQGWTPPQPPSQIPPERQAEYEQLNNQEPPGNRTERLVLRVDPGPKWIQEYPYYWKYGYVDCGQTTYLYYYPYPDLHLIKEMTGEQYSAGEDSPGGCGYYQVVGISKPSRPDPDWVEREQLIDQMHLDIGWSRKGLDDCTFATENSPQSILVCFNGGEASKVFDAPAYLDTTVSRVRVPVRFVSELMGAKVTWQEAAGQVTIDFPEVEREIVKLTSKPGYSTTDWWIPNTFDLADGTTEMKREPVFQPARQIVLIVGEKTAYVDGQPVTIDAPPVILPPGRTMVPLRFVSEQLGAKVYWVGDDPIFPYLGGLAGTYEVHIYTPFHPWFDSPNWFLENRGVKS